MEPVRFGLVGYGFGGRYFHAPLIASAPECALVAVATGAAQRRAQVEAELPGTATVAGLEELAAAGAEAVAISTPADTHTALAERALDLGLAVVCDKPFALDAEAARGTVERAAERGLALSPYQNRRWDSEFATVRRLVAEGALGEVTRFESRFERFAPQAGPPAAGGGTLLDFGSHLVDQALVLLGPVEAVYAELRRRESGLDDDVFVALTHRGGARSHLWGSWSQSAPGPRYRVTGTTGSCVLVDGDGQEEALVAGRTPASEGEGWGVEPDGFRARLHRDGADEPLRPERGRWDSFYPAFAAAVRGTGDVPVDPRDAVATATVLDAALASATTGQVVALPA
ncbi:Gfo/Idh/MocA family protein [Pseudonocardia lacus]|uniref:Gfo/Idh/MocA family protein n=1 Tax=Pseudonocardia lacus TaxID=2835865 RepID=UPI001BDC23AE|nr:Gfo/Idh/MocA family oxidoreductase [Pseudonocardia lacus]